MAEPTTQRIKFLAQIRDPFGRIPNIIIDLYGAAMGKAGWLYTILTRFSNGESSESFASVRTLAATGGIDTKTVQVWADHLENLGLLRIEKDKTWAQEKRRPRPNTYILLLPPLPPTPETIKAHFPTDWTPQPRALKALLNISSFLTLDSRPQEQPDESGSVGTTPTDPSPPSPPPPGGSVGISPTVSRNLSDAPSEPLPRNKLSLTSEPLQENNNNVVVTDPLTGLTAKFKTKDPTVTTDTMQGFFEDCLELKAFDRDDALEYLEEKINVVLDMKKADKPQALLKSAILRDWKPNALRPTGKSPDQKILQKRQEAADLDRKLREEQESRKKAPINDILDYYKSLNPHAIKFDTRIKLTQGQFEGNPLLAQAIEQIRTEEK